MNLIDAGFLALLMVLMFLGPIYVSHLEARWFQRVFKEEVKRSPAFCRSLSRMHQHARRSIVLLALAVDATVAFTVLLFPGIPTVLAGIGVITRFLIHRRTVVRRKCPQCFSTIEDGTTRCPDCSCEIADAWGIDEGRIRADWLRSENRFFRYKCS